MAALQLRFATGIVPSSESVADPLNEIVSPTRHVAVVEGDAMTGTGGLLPTWMSCVSVPVAAPLSVTRRPTVTLPVVEYVREVVTPVASLYCPSPSRSQA